MDIAVNTRLLLSHRMEGVARYIYETTKRLVLNHPEDRFHFFFDRPYDKQFIFAENVEPHILSPPARHPILWYLWFERAIPRYLDKYKIDVFYSGDMYLSMRSKVPTLMVTHDLNYLHYPRGIRWSHLKYYQHYMPRFHHRADHLIAVSHATKKDVVHQYGLSEEKISVAYNSCPSGFRKFTESEKEEARRIHTGGSPYFVYVGSVHPRKNVDRLILAFDHFKSKYGTEHKLVIYGRMAWKTEAVSVALDQINHKDDVVFLSNKEALVQSVMASAEALCYISLFEGFGIPIVEAYASGVPVITSNVSSMPEVAGEGALIVDPNDTEDISQAMHKIIDRGTKERLISKGTEQLAKFSWEESAQHIYEQLQRLGNR